MTSTNFYNKENLYYVIKKKTGILISLICFICFFVIAALVFILLATYENKFLIDIIGSVILSILVILIVLSIMRLRHIKGILLQYNFILTHDGEDIVCKIVSTSDMNYTLADGTVAKEVKIKYEDNTRIVYLIDTFDFDFVIDKEYKLHIVSDYIKEISYED